MVNVTKHAYKRMKERCGYSKSTCQRMAEKAFAEGVSHADVSGRLDKYFYQLYCYDYSANNLRIYGEFVYVFSDHNLVTVMLLPNDLKDSVKKKDHEYQKKNFYVMKSFIAEMFLHI